ncbi:rod shape-determining protein RodA [Ornithinimicrobium faecis]|uniref:peptidoglycan glycosyltransferase n=1 Tax=Ornithinimicrobium faecis TaxID=2934158 RepID=A0ABY4YP62_9MICO|nr:rod shape-determining protein RodA [Ornithinimicrobium sp. HY1793]USQ78549.1 rod shape-determining protein RodA [Ornithinimicrobium sp. HY1793]
MAWLRIDWGLYIAALGLSLIGAVLVWSGTHADVGPALAVRHLINTGIGVTMAVLLLRVDVRWIRATAPWLYLTGLLGLVVVLTPLGVTINGSRSWIHLPGGFSLQPAELSKIALCVGLAMILAEGRDTTRPPTWREVLTAWGLAGVPIVLILLQPDLGTALVLGFLTVGVVAASGAARRWTALAVGGAALAVTAAIRIPLLDAYQLDRLLAFVDPSRDPQGIGYQTQQARLAIGSGGWSGAGVGQGPQTQGGFIPFQHTDFVFSIAGEELGLIGCLGIIGLLLFVVLRALWVALRTDDPFARLVAVGVAGWLLFQTVENIGMNVGLMPVTGLPLPFLSYGGSSMFACWLAVGLVAACQRPHDRSAPRRRRSVPVRRSAALDTRR